MPPGGGKQRSLSASGGRRESEEGGMIKAEIREKEWLEGVYERICTKMLSTAGRNRHTLPYTAKDGVFNDLSQKDPCWWTNGFWSGILWQLYHATKNEMYREMAEEVEDKLDQCLMDHRGMDHDSGFRWLPTSVVNYRLTGNEKSYNRARLAADNMAGRYNPAGRFIRAWNDWGEEKKTGWAIIDCMMNLPLLYWAHEQTGDPRYLRIATDHADTAMKYFIRPDGSAKHIVEFNPETGEYIRSYGGQGYAHGSSWTRGQAWALYGFTLSYIHTKNPEYLACAKRVANYFLANIPDTGLIPVDFRQPEDCALEDSTAAAIASCGLLEISGCLEGRERSLYRDAAVTLLYTLDTKRCDWDEGRDSIVQKCTAAFHDAEHEFPIIYGDYYFIEAIWKLTGHEIFIW